MSLFQCEKCGARENTSNTRGRYWMRGDGPKLCSECLFGEWHGRFPKVILPLGMFYTDGGGNLRHNVTKKYPHEMGFA